MTISLALALLASTAAATATEATTTATETTVTLTETAPQQVAEKKNKPKKICKSNAATTGSRIAKRVCKTEEEWAEKEDGQEVGVKSQGGMEADPLARDLKPG